MEKKKISPCKVVVLGEARVGKTSLTLRYVQNVFNEGQESTNDAACLEKVVEIDGHNLKLMIWDTAGQERYRALNPVYYRGAEGALVVYDLTDIESFDRMN